MKKLFNLLLILGLFCTSSVFADEVVLEQKGVNEASRLNEGTTPPDVKANENKAVIAVQKQPANKEQKQTATRNIACIIIQINGKIEESVNYDNDINR